MERIDLDLGSLTPEQVRLVMKHVPLDLTFVDADDRVAFYSEAYRIFKRAPSDIGRDVTECHSPATRSRVAQLIDELKTGWRDVAEFLERTDGRLVQVRYIAVRDEQGAYCGVLEVAQDVADVAAAESVPDVP